MLDSLTSLLSTARHLSPKFIFAATLASTILLFAPIHFLEKIGVLNFVTDKKFIIGMVFITSASFASLEIISPLLRQVSKIRTEHRKIKNYKTVFSELTEAEKEILRPYIYEGENTQHFPLQDGAAAGLQAKSILYRAANLSLPIPGSPFPYNLQPKARLVLNEDPSVLE